LIEKINIFQQILTLLMRYLRDGRAPIPIEEKTSKVMRANKSKNTRPELLLRKALREKGIIGYRLHWKTVPGRPDISFISKKTAIFINGCFWHRCPRCDMPLPKSHRQWWKKKFEKNKERDKKKTNELRKAGWKVLVLWECEIEKDTDKAVKKVLKILMDRS